MRWITDAGLRLWQAYLDGLKMSCPAHDGADDTLESWPCNRDRKPDVSTRNHGQKEATLH